MPWWPRPIAASGPPQWGPGGGADRASPGGPGARPAAPAVPYRSPHLGESPVSSHPGRGPRSSGGSGNTRAAEIPRDKETRRQAPLFLAPEGESRTPGPQLGTRRAGGAEGSRPRDPKTPSSLTSGPGTRRPPSPAARCQRGGRGPRSGAPRGPGRRRRSGPHAGASPRSAPRRAHLDSPAATSTRRGDAEVAPRRPGPPSCARVPAPGARTASLTCASLGRRPRPSPFLRRRRLLPCSGVPDPPGPRLNPGRRCPGAQGDTPERKQVRGHLGQGEGTGGSCGSGGAGPDGGGGGGGRSLRAESRSRGAARRELGVAPPASSPGGQFSAREKRVSRPTSGGLACRGRFEPRTRFGLRRRVPGSADRNPL